MKKIYRYILCGVMALTAVSCDSFLDINENPNQATSSTPQQVLPNALTVTASNVVAYNDYGSFIVGYIVNAGGFGGWDTEFTYNYTTANFNGLWSSTYDNLLDYNFIEQAAAGNGSLAYYEAMAKIMKAYNFQMLVDTYGNVPYSQALQGGNNLTPAYDNAEDIYKDLVVKLDAAIALLDNSPNANSVSANSDVLFKGDMQRWKQFANSIKLRVLVRASKKPGAGAPAAWVTAGFNTFNAATPFLTDDAIVNPGYAPTSGKQNPMWERYHSTAAGANAGQGRSRIPSRFVHSFYNGAKLLDEGRGKVIYRSFPATTYTGQLGDGEDNPTAPNNTIAWYTGTGTGLDAENTTGLFKGRTMGQPIMLAAESYLLQAEAIARGFMPGDAKAAFNNGITASFRYFYKDVNGQIIGTPDADAAKYIAANPTSALVNFDLADTEAKKAEAIITQKYVALNFIHGHEAYNEFRRTGYPSISGNSATSTFASIGSASPRADRLPTRILYPASEYSLNPNNAPSGISPFTTRIFWDAD